MEYLVECNGQEAPRVSCQEARGNVHMYKVGVVIEWPENTLFRFKTFSLANGYQAVHTELYS